MAELLGRPAHDAIDDDEAAGDGDDDALGVAVEAGGAVRFFGPHPGVPVVAVTHGWLLLCASGPRWDTVWPLQ